MSCLVPGVQYAYIGQIQNTIQSDALEDRDTELLRKNRLSSTVQHTHSSGLCFDLMRRVGPVFFLIMDSRFSMSVTSGVANRHATITKC